MKIKHFLLISTSLTFGSINAQTEALLTFSAYMNKVQTNNIQYLTEKHNISIAEANAKVARISPDPELSIGASDNQQRKLKMGYNFDAELSYNFEMGGKRRQRIDLAKNNFELTGILTENFFRQMRADATISYMWALKQKFILNIYSQLYSSVKQQAEASTQGVDSLETLMEMTGLWNDLAQSEAEYKNALVDLSLLQNDKIVSDNFEIKGDFSQMKRTFDLGLLINQALNNRTDLQAAIKSKELSQNTLKLIKANRTADLGLTVGASRSTIIKNDIAPTPAFTSVYAGISIPLKFSNLNKGEINAAKFAAQQSELSYEAVEKQIQAEVIKAYNIYSSTCLQVDRFDKYVLVNAENVFRDDQQKYKHGHSGITEAIESHRSHNDILKAYYEVLYNRAVALVELERVCGIWDVEL